MQNIYSLRLPAGLLQTIDNYEKDNFSKPSKVLERTINILPKTGEVALLYIMASTIDADVSIIYSHDGVEQCRQLPITEKGSLGHILFLHCLTTLPVYSALVGQYDMEYIYFFAQKLSETIQVGSPSTYPKYVEHITPAMYQEHDYALNMYRFMLVGESRDPQNTVALRSCVRYLARPVHESLSSNINEVYPVIQYGPYVLFNSYVPFPAQILGPFHDTCELPIADEYDLKSSTAVEAVSEKRVTIHAINGIVPTDVPIMSIG